MISNESKKRAVGARRLNFQVEDQRRLKITTNASSRCSFLHDMVGILAGILVHHSFSGAIYVCNEPDLRTDYVLRFPNPNMRLNGP